MQAVRGECPHHGGDACLFMASVIAAGYAEAEVDLRVEREARERSEEVLKGNTERIASLIARARAAESRLRDLESDEAVERAARALHETQHPALPWDKMNEHHRAHRMREAKTICDALLEGGER